MLPNTYECLAITLRSLRIVANCIRKPIRHIFATVGEFAANIIVLHLQGYSPQCESSIIEDSPMDTTLSIMLVSHCGEYMANGLTNAVRHAFAMIAK